MEIIKILSTRGSNTKVYSDLIYEWEDDYSIALNAPIYGYSFYKEKILHFTCSALNRLHLTKLMQLVDRLFRSDKKSLVFTLYPFSKFNSRTGCNKIPFIIDFDYRVDLKTFYNVYRNCEKVIISSRVAYEYLKTNNCPLNIVYVPLSIKANLKLKRIDINERKYDIFIARQNPILMEYLKRYEDSHTDVHYIVRRWEDNKLYSCNAYYSNKEGRLGEFSDRKAYFNLLCNSKVAFYSTPGSDMPEKRFMNHVTPALLEYITAGCQIMIRWVDTPDSEYFNLPQNFENAQTYEDFERLLNHYRSTTENGFDKCDKYLEKYGFKSQFEIFKKVICL